MMRHLTDEQIIDAAEGGLPEAPATHLARCHACALRVRELQQTLLQIGEVDVPEPSPLFWRQFVTNVNAAIRDAPAAPIRSSSSWVWGWAGAAAIFVLSVIGFQLMRPGEPLSQPAAPTVRGEAGAEPADLLDVETDEAWAVVRSLAEDLHYDEAREAGVIPQPGAVERAATELSDEERAELIRLIEDEMKRTGA